MLKNNKFLIFDVHGNQLALKIDSNIDLSDFTLTQCQVVSPLFDDFLDPGDFLCLAFESPKQNLLKVLSLKKNPLTSTYDLAY